MRTELHTILLVLSMTSILVACSQGEATPAPQSNAPRAAGAATTSPAAATPTLAPAAPTATAVPKPKYGGTLKWATNQDTAGMDMAAPTVYEMGTGRAMRQIYNGLIQYEPETQKLLPELATEWSVSNDGKEITFKLRAGVKFHDGTPFNAEAVKFYFERLIGVVDPKRVGRARANYHDLKGVDIVDDLTAKFVLQKPQASLMNFLGDATGFISSPTAYKKDPDAYPRNPVGTGPMKVKEWVKDTRLVLERYPDYWEKDKDGNKYPYLDSIIMTPITDTTVQITNVRTGAMDIAEDVPPPEVAKVKADANLAYYEKLGFSAENIGIRQNIPPWDNRACREAFFGAVDKDAISKSVYFGVSKPAETIISAASQYYDPNTKGVPFDLNRAKQKLAECGKPDGYQVDIYTLAIPRVVARMEAVQAQVAKIGIKVNILPRDAGAILSEYLQQRKGNGFAGQSMATSDPLGTLLNFWCNAPANYQGTCYPELEKLYDEAESAFDLNKRKAVLQEIAKFTSHSPWTWHMFDNPETAVASKKVKGIRMGPQSMQHFKWVWLE